jgi:hypothetical protein
MLTVRAALLAVLFLLAPWPAAAEGAWLNSQGKEADESATVTVGASTPGSTGTTTRPAGTTGAEADLCPGAPGGRCTDSSGGWWSGNHECYLVAADVPPELAALHPQERAFRCTSAPRLVDGTLDLTAVFWVTAGAVGPDPAVLARRAVDSMQLRAFDVGLTPPPGSANPSLVGIPTWMWVQQPTATTFGPATASASAGALSVTATAKVSSVTWDMGDGTRVQCGAGTPYQAAFGDRPSPTCGHRFGAPGTYTVRATSNWVVDWEATNGQRGRLALPLSNATTVRVAQGYALVTQNG